MAWLLVYAYLHACNESILSSLLVLRESRCCYKIALIMYLFSSYYNEHLNLFCRILKLGFSSLKIQIIKPTP